MHTHKSKALIKPNTDIIQPTKKKTRWRNTEQQRLFMKAWTSPDSNTFANAFQSALSVGYSESYSKNITHLAPSWLSEYMERTKLNDELIEAGITALALDSPNSKSPDDTRLRAFELLAKLKGLVDNKNNSGNVQVNVQPILGGATQDRTTINVKK